MSTTAIATTIATAAIAVGSSRIELPSGMVLSDRTSKTGKVLGSRLTFTGVKSASDLRAEGKAAGMKGKALDEYVNKSLRGDVATAAWVRHDAIMSGLRSAGVVPTELLPNKAGNKFKAEYIMAEDSSAKVTAEKDAEIAALKAELEALKAKA